MNLRTGKVPQDRKPGWPSAARVRLVVRSRVWVLPALVTVLTAASATPAAAQQQGPSSFGLDLLRGAIAEDPSKAQRPPQPPASQPPAEAGALQQSDVVVLLGVPELLVVAEKRLLHG